MTDPTFKERIGVGTVNYALQRTGPTRQRKVIADEGPRRGNVVAIETDHKSGRQDARVFAPPAHRTINLTGGDAA